MLVEGAGGQHHQRDAERGAALGYQQRQFFDARRCQVKRDEHADQQFPAARRQQEKGSGFISCRSELGIDEAGDENNGEQRQPPALAVSMRHDQQQWKEQVKLFLYPRFNVLEREPLLAVATPVYGRPSWPIGRARSTDRKIGTFPALQGSAIVMV